MGLSDSQLVWAFLPGTLIGLIAQPLVGACSDSYQSAWGRRQPFIFGGALCLVAFYTLLANSYSLGTMLGDESRVEEPNDLRPCVEQNRSHNSTNTLNAESAERLYSTLTEPIYSCDLCLTFVNVLPTPSLLSLRSDRSLPPVFSYPLLWARFATWIAVAAFWCADFAINACQLPVRVLATDAIAHAHQDEVMSRFSILTALARYRVCRVRCSLYF